MVEFIVAFPLVLLFLAGLIQLGWLFLAQHLLHATTQHISLYAAANQKAQTEFISIFVDRMKQLPHGGLAIPKFELSVDKDLEDSSFWQNTEHGVKVLKSDFVIARLTKLSEQEREEWLRANTPTLRVEWCFPLRVPVINQLFELALKDANECALYGGNGVPYIRLESQTRFTMKSDFQMPNND
ncbi:MULTISPECIES: TadE/TadG family type IV pilus assembly protein [Gammaproteobacteria]|uniref:TadE/TadG family type IV pilus assembly protein n=1 Tax=Gammaproteobacteria TaxID=1236 RepID=UPI0014026272|nr:MULTISPECIES: TadE family protein [Gammaproteobacteria]